MWAAYVCAALTSKFHIWKVDRTGLICDLWWKWESKTHEQVVLRRGVAIFVNVYILILDSCCVLELMWTGTSCFPRFYIVLLLWILYLFSSGRVHHLWFFCGSKYFFVDAIKKRKRMRAMLILCVCVCVCVCDNESRKSHTAREIERVMHLDHTPTHTHTHARTHTYTCVCVCT